MFKFEIISKISMIGILVAFSYTAPASQYDTELLSLTNAERQKAGLPALKLSSQLGQAAQNHAKDMAINNYFSHTGLDGSQPSERAAAVGYSYSYVGENISAGRTIPSDTIQGWMNSQGHRENILNPNYTEIGFGYAYSKYSQYRHYWVQVFGKSSDTSASTPQPVQIARLINLSTRAPVEGGAYDIIAGFITQTSNQNLDVIIRGWGLETGMKPKLTLQTFPDGNLVAEPINFRGYAAVRCVR
jgi:hypothetical protein